MKNNELLYQPGSFQLNLIDMGACVDYPEKFTKPYMELVHGAVIGDRDIVHKKSIGKSYSTILYRDEQKDADKFN